jgi:hypothetical protein
LSAKPAASEREMKEHAFSLLLSPHVVWEFLPAIQNHLFLARFAATRKIIAISPVVKFATLIRVGTERAE